MIETLIVLFFATLTSLGAVFAFGGFGLLLPVFYLICFIASILFPGIGETILREAGTIRDEWE